tara:strand:+ start:1301 stop:2596 length:1296 start_codon:yes stop_codon:yes gene_type:complete
VHERFSGVKGFLEKPPESASGHPLSGRFVCHAVQWTGRADDLFGTFTITARELLHAAESNMLWTDQGVQRGAKPEVKGAATELTLSEGYPNSDLYIFNEENADEMADKLLEGRRLFLSPLIWNLRPGKFEGFVDEKKFSLHIFDGKIYLPDSHHRHQAIIKAARIYRENPSEYSRFSLEKQFRIELYFLSREDEGNYFYDKNQRPRQTARSKAYDLTTEDALSILAKRIIDSSRSLKGNVNRVTDRLTAKNHQVVTLSTLREMAKSFVDGDYIDESEVDGAATIAAKFYDMIANVRDELAVKSSAERVVIRRDLLVDSAVMMHGYAGLISSYFNDMAKLGASEAETVWRRKLSRLSRNVTYQYGDWSGDLFSKQNPLWRELGILKPNARGTGFAQVNNGATRSTAVRALKSVCDSVGSVVSLDSFVEKMNE